MLGVRICCLEAMIPTLIASVYGFDMLRRRYKGLYFVMGVLAIFCMFVGQLAYFISTFVASDRTMEFHISALGSVGSCLFFLTANIGPINMLSDAENAKIKKSRTLACLGPVIAAILYGACVLVMKQRDCYKGLTLGIILTVITMLPIYFSTRAAITPDVDNGFFFCMRPFNYSAVVLMLLNIVERGMRKVWGGSEFETVLLYVFYGVIGLSTLAVVVFLKRGARKWKNI